jgi:hypothetical protein
MVVATIRLTPEQLTVWRERGPHAVRAWLDGWAEVDSGDCRTCTRYSHYGKICMSADPCIDGNRYERADGGRVALWATMAGAATW